MYKKITDITSVWTKSIRGYTVSSIIITVLFTTNLLFVNKFKSLTPVSHIIHYDPITRNDISCHDIAEKDLPKAENVNLFFPKSIFFHETSCKGGLDSRQACSIESAARANPEWHVNVLFSGPLNEIFLRGNSLAKLQEIYNVKFARINMTKYVKGTPIETMMAKNSINKSYFRMEHTADILRLLTLNKYGGIYLDLDILVVKNFDSLPKNWVAREKSHVIGNSVLAVSTDDVGRNFSNATLRELETNYKPNTWSHNGQYLIMRVLKQICSTTNVAAMSARKCKGIQVYDSKYFFPLHWSNHHKYFEPGKINWEDSYTYHLWNKLTHANKVPQNSLYAKLAERFCPTIYELYGGEFGS